MKPSTYAMKIKTTTTNHHMKGSKPVNSLWGFVPVSTRNTHGLIHPLGVRACFLLNLLLSRYWPLFLLTTFVHSPTRPSHKTSSCTRQLPLHFHFLGAHVLCLLQFYLFWATLANWLLFGALSSLRTRPTLPRKLLSTTTMLLTGLCCHHSYISEAHFLRWFVIGKYISLPHMHWAYRLPN